MTTVMIDCHKFDIVRLSILTFIRMTIPRLTLNFWFWLVWPFGQPWQLSWQAVINFPLSGCQFQIYCFDHATFDSWLVILMNLIIWPAMTIVMTGCHRFAILRLSIPTVISFSFPGCQFWLLFICLSRLTFDFWFLLVWPVGQPWQLSWQAVMSSRRPHYQFEFVWPFLDF